MNIVAYADMVRALNKQIIVGLVIFLQNQRSKDDVKIPGITIDIETEINIDMIRICLHEVSDNRITGVLRSISSTNDRSFKQDTCTLFRTMGFHQEDIISLHKRRRMKSKNCL